jgi:hypothetical protein
VEACSASQQDRSISINKIDQQNDRSANRGNYLQTIAKKLCGEQRRAGNARKDAKDALPGKPWGACARASAIDIAVPAELPASAATISA